MQPVQQDITFARTALRLARRGYGSTSPNPMVGAVLVRRGNVIGQGWHRRAGEPHAEIEALRDAQRRGFNPKGATLYVTLEPCSTHGRTPPCTDAIIQSGIRRVVVGTTDPNPKHAGCGFELLKQAGIEVVSFSECGPESSNLAKVRRQIAAQCEQLNEAFNHWIVHRTPFVTVKAAMTLDGKIATASGQSKWITGEQARRFGMQLRLGSDAILVGINTVLHDNPSLTVRIPPGSRNRVAGAKPLRRIILDSRARTPLNARIVTDELASSTTIVVGARAPGRRVAALAKRVRVMVSPPRSSRARHPRTTPASSAAAIDLKWLLRELGRENVTSLLVEGGGEVNASFLMGGLAHRIAFFYAPKILGGRNARKGVAGDGAQSLDAALRLRDLRWRQLGPDLLLTARTEP